MSSLVARYGTPGAVNGEVFNALGAKIRGKSKLPRGQRIICFSPHPDDDVISMGGILRKLVENENEIIVAYMTSGNIAVFDHDVRRYVDFLERLAARPRASAATTVRDARRPRCTSSSTRKQPGDVDIPEVQDIKRIIRESRGGERHRGDGPDARATRGSSTCRSTRRARCGRIRSARPTSRSCATLLEELQPEHHLRRRRPVRSARHAPHVQGGDRRRAARAARHASSARRCGCTAARGRSGRSPRRRGSCRCRRKSCALKIQAIFKHQSQKDSAPFPGQDEREFWQRVEARNKDTAALLDRLGLAEYFAMEAYVVDVERAQMTRGSPRSTPSSWSRTSSAPRRSACGSGAGRRDAKDYFVADRAIPWWAVLFSIVASETSALTFISIPGLYALPSAISDSCRSSPATSSDASSSRTCCCRATSRASSSRRTRCSRQRFGLGDAALHVDRVHGHARHGRLGARVRDGDPGRADHRPVGAEQGVRDAGRDPRSSALLTVHLHVHGRHEGRRVDGARCRPASTSSAASRRSCCSGSSVTGGWGAIIGQARRRGQAAGASTRTPGSTGRTRSAPG